MENFNDFPSDITGPCPDVQNTSSFLQVQTQDGDIHYPNTQHFSPYSQPDQISLHLEQESEMNFQSSVSQNTIPSEIPSSVPIAVSSHSQESLQTHESDESRRLKAKIARANRKIAMQRSSVKNTSQSSSSGTSRKSRKKTFSESNKISDEDHNTLYTPYNVRLRVVLRKMLTCSDVSDQGRILLPKKEVEENLPGLATREGVFIVMKEVFSYTEWTMKYRFWANYKGKIYLFDQCDDFVQKNMLEAGDQLNLYQDEQKNLYFTIKKKAKHTAEPCNNYISVTSETTEEEDSLRILMEELEHKEEDEPYTLTSLYNAQTNYP